VALSGNHGCPRRRARVSGADHPAGPRSTKAGIRGDPARPADVMAAVQRCDDGCAPASEAPAALDSAPVQREAAPPEEGEEEEMQKMPPALPLQREEGDENDESA